MSPFVRKSLAVRCICEVLSPVSSASACTTPGISRLLVVGMAAWDLAVPQFVFLEQSGAFIPAAFFETDSNLMLPSP